MTHAAPPVFQCLTRPERPQFSSAPQAEAAAQQAAVSVPQYPVAAPPPAPTPSFWSQVRLLVVCSKAPFLSEPRLAIISPV